MEVVLRNYQLDVIDRTSCRFRDGFKRVCIQGATGAGKNHITAEITRRAYLRGKRVVFLAHRRGLISQYAERLDLFGVPYGILMAGYKNESAPVQVASKDTLLSRTIRNEWHKPPQADLVIIDECHRTLGEEYMRLLEFYKDSFVVGCTATPTREDGKGLGDYYQALECTVPTSQLVKEGWLCPVRCYAPEIQIKGKGKVKRSIAGDPVKWWRNYAEGRPTILFAATKKASIACSVAFSAAGYPAEHMEDKTPDDEREAIVDRLRSGKTMIICNVGILGEGIDIPQLSCCILLCMAGSYTKFAQAVGRIMRPHESKKDAILIDHSGAVLVHGFPDEDVEWKLDIGESVDERIKKAKKAGDRKAPIVCPQCAYIFESSNVCPSCGYKLPAKRVEQTALKQQMLIEVPREVQIARDLEHKKRSWASCLAIQANMGRTMAAASAMFKRKHGVWPDASLGYYIHGSLWHRKVADVFPQFVRTRKEIQ